MGVADLVGLRRADVVHLDAEAKRERVALAVGVADAVGIDRQQGGEIAGRRIALFRQRVARLAIGQPGARLQSHQAAEIEPAGRIDEAARVLGEGAELGLHLAAEIARERPVFLGRRLARQQGREVRLRGPAQAGADDVIDQLVERAGDMRIVADRVLNAAEQQIAALRRGEVAGAHRRPKGGDVLRVKALGAIGRLVIGDERAGRAVAEHGGGPGEAVEAKGAGGGAQGGGDQKKNPMPPWRRHCPATRARSSLT